MIWIISGTQDGREIGAKLADREINKSPEKRQEILMTVVSQYGKVLAAHKGIDVEVGRFKQEDMVRIIKEKHIILMPAIPMRRLCLKQHGVHARRLVLTMYGLNVLRFRFPIMINFIMPRMSLKQQAWQENWGKVFF